MNKILLLAFAFLMMGSISQANENLKHSADLTEFRMDPKDSKLSAIVFGRLDISSKAISLMLSERSRICVSAPCAQPKPILIVLPIKSIQPDGCGSTIYTAELDARPVDGDFKQITVVDHRNRLCENVILAMTEVTYTQKAYYMHPVRPVSFEATSYMYGEKLSTTAE